MERWQSKVRGHHKFVFEYKTKMPLNNWDKLSQKVEYKYLQAIKIIACIFIVIQINNAQ